MCVALHLCFGKEFCLSIIDIFLSAFHQNEELKAEVLLLKRRDGGTDGINDVTPVTGESRLCVNLYN